MPMPRLRWMFMSALAVFLFLITSTVFYYEIKNLSRLQAALAESMYKLREKERSVANYREKIAFYETDAGMAHKAREQHNLVFQGEQVYIIRRDATGMEVSRP